MRPERYSLPRQSRALLALLGGLGLLFALVGGCSAVIPDGRYACPTGVECPPGFACRDGFCFRGAFDGGALDLGFTDLGSADLGPTDLGVDGPAPDLGPCMPATMCDDGLFCNGPDFCAVDGVCGIHTVPPCVAPDTCAEDLARCCPGDCDDGNPCTDDTGCGGTACVFTAVASRPCDDGQFCTGADRCGADGLCSTHTGSPCGAEVCNETMNHCDGVACGAIAQTCCAGTCATGVCDGTDHCVLCGAAGQPCCAGLMCSPGAGTCSAVGVCSVPCGGDGQPCCGGSMCSMGLSCATGLCTCGGLGQACCDGSRCSGGAICDTGTCAPPPCGGAWQACCPPPTPCFGVDRRCFDDGTTAPPTCVRCGSAVNEICCPGDVCFDDRICTPSPDGGLSTCLAP